MKFEPKQVSGFTITKDLGKVDSDLRCAIQCKFQGSEHCDTFHFDDDSNCKIGKLEDDATDGNIKVFTSRNLNSQQNTDFPVITTTAAPVTTNPSTADPVTTNPSTAAPVTTNPNPNPGQPGEVCFKTLARVSYWIAKTVPYCTGELPEVLNEATFNAIESLLRANAGLFWRNRKVWLGVQKNHAITEPGSCQSTDCLIGRWNWVTSGPMTAEHVGFYETVEVDYSNPDHQCLQISMNGKKIQSANCNEEGNYQVAVLCREGC